MADQLAPVRGVGQWIWELGSCEGGDIAAIVNRCHANHIDYVIVKAADGMNTWDQYTAALVNGLHGGGIRVLAWSYFYAANPQAELEAVLTALGRAVPDGFVIDAEIEIERLNLSSPGQGDQAAQTLCSGIRNAYPSLPLYLSSFPIVTYHPTVPYATFRQYCSAFLPQIYFNDLGRAPVDAVNWCQQALQQLSATAGWEIVPTGQTYNTVDVDMAAFAAAAAQTWPNVGINWWSYQHMSDMGAWNALASSGATYSSRRPPSPPKPTPPTPSPAPTATDYAAAAWIHSLDTMASGVPVINCQQRKAQILEWIKAHP